ncbi:MAG: hypothetical protein QXT16_08690 [Candidatus Caldarchaeum sp.]
MPLYKTGTEMFRKYSAKFVPETVGARFGQVADIAKSRAQEGLTTVGSVRDLIRPILDNYGIGGGQRATYLAFGTALLRHVLRQKGQTATKTANGLKSYYVTAYDLNPSICDEIIQVVTGWAIPY